MNSFEYFLEQVIELTILTATYCKEIIDCTHTYEMGFSLLLVVVCQVSNCHGRIFILLKHLYEVLFHGFRQIERLSITITYPM